MEEILLAIINFLGEIFGEIILQLVFEVLAEWLSRSTPVRLLTEWFSQFWQGLLGISSPTDVTENKPHPVGSFVLYATLGWAMGIFSMLLLPQHLIHTMSHRWLNLLITPLIAGGVMAWLGCWHDKHGRRVVGLDRFFNGWGFALAFAVARYVWCK